MTVMAALTDIVRDFRFACRSRSPVQLLLCLRRCAAATVQKYQAIGAIRRTENGAKLWDTLLQPSPGWNSCEYVAWRSGTKGTVQLWCAPTQIDDEWFDRVFDLKDIKRLVAGDGPIYPRGSFAKGLRLKSFGVRPTNQALKRPFEHLDK